MHYIKCHTVKCHSSPVNIVKVKYEFADQLCAWFQTAAYGTFSFWQEQNSLCETIVLYGI